jgi:hypothetical protein
MMSDIFNLNVNELTTVGSVGIGVTDPIYSLEVQGQAGIELFSSTTSGNVLNFRPSLGDASKYNMSISAFDHSGGGVGTADGLSINGFDGVSIATGASSVRQERMRITSGGSVGIGTDAPSASAILDAQSTTKGVRMPNMTTTQKNAIASPAAGLMVYDTTLAKLCVYTTAWETITST